MRLKDRPMIRDDDIIFTEAAPGSPEAKRISELCLEVFSSWSPSSWSSGEGNQIITPAIPFEENHPDALCSPGRRENSPNYFDDISTTSSTTSDDDNSVIFIGATSPRYSPEGYSDKSDKNEGFVSIASPINSPVYSPTSPGYLNTSDDERTSLPSHSPTSPEYSNTSDEDINNSPRYSLEGFPDKSDNDIVSVSTASPIYSPRYPGYLNTTDDESPSPKNSTTSDEDIDTTALSHPKIAPGSRNKICVSTTSQNYSPTSSGYSKTRESVSTSPRSYATLAPDFASNPNPIQKEKVRLFLLRSVKAYRQQLMFDHCLIGPANVRYQIFSKGDSHTATVIGSEPERKHVLQRKLVLYDKTLRKTHCVIKTYEKSGRLTSHAKRGVLKINNKQVDYEKPTAIHHGDQIQIGEKTYQYQVAEPKTPRSRCHPVVNVERYLGNLKKNKNYKPSQLVLRK